MDKRNFLKLSALSLALPDLLKGQSAPARVMENPDRHYWDKDTRLTIAMWDFSWLSDQGKGGSYENLEQRVVEAVERGYNTLRVDCFPSRVLEKTTSLTSGLNPGERKGLPGWGRVTTSFSCNALEKLKQFADICRKHKIWLGLDSWDKAHMIRRNYPMLFQDANSSIIPVSIEEKVFRDFGHTWVEALRLMREEGILERAVWVAPMNEVPHFATRSIESIRQIGALDQNEGDVKMEMNQKLNDRYRLINLWMAEEIKDEISRENIPLSYSSLSQEQFAKRLPEIYDVVDVHYMPPVIMNEDERNELAAITRGVRENFQGFETMDMKRYSELWDRACRNNYAAMLARTISYMNTVLENLVFPSGKRMQAVITESFGPCYWPDHPDVSWVWYKQYNADAARIAAALPFEGISLSNYGEPIFSLWDDVDWHRNTNLFILTNKGQAHHRLYRTGYEW